MNLENSTNSINNEYDRTDPFNLDNIRIQKITKKTVVVVRPIGREVVQPQRSVRQNPFPEDPKYEFPVLSNIGVSKTSFSNAPSTPIQRTPTKTSNGSTERKIAFELANLYSDKSNVEYYPNIAVSTIRKLF